MYSMALTGFKPILPCSRFCHHSADLVTKQSQSRNNPLPFPRLTKEWRPRTSAHARSCSLMPIPCPRSEHRPTKARERQRIPGARQQRRYLPGRARRCPGAFRPGGRSETADSHLPHPVNNTGRASRYPPRSDRRYWRCGLFPRFRLRAGASRVPSGETTRCIERSAAHLLSSSRAP